MQKEEGSRAMNGTAFTDIEKSALITRTLELKSDGFRLAQICASRKGTEERLELLYSFARGETLVNLRVALGPGEPVESVCWLYPYAFLYENEMKDLFGVDVAGMNLDFNGRLYRKAAQTPFFGKEGA
jgi:ech hydrogenase subunit D